ncbi:MAG TPA: hypothetical protein VK974_05535 [Methylophilaceae bacterium]|nr:hypothetical protein [Methylophilaceae bacterium]
MLTNKLKTIAVIAISLSLSACLTARTKQEGKEEIKQELKQTAITVNETLEQRKQSTLEYAANMMAAPADAQKKELAELNQSYATNKQFVDTRMKLALLYALPASKVKDTIKAQALLDDLIREPSLDIERKTLASILRDYIADTGKLAQKARDEQKRSDGLQTKADLAQQKADSLQRKLDDLKNIEKTMTDRDQGSK